jgi:hypothetical protein
MSSFPELDLDEQVLRTALSISRSDIFGEMDAQLPISEIRDANVPQIGFIGANYRQGGDLLLGINPGGGGDTYRRTAEDERRFGLITSFDKGAADGPSARQVCEATMKGMRTWRLWKIVSAVLDACGAEQDEVAYLNWCPFRTRKDKMPVAKAMRNAGTLYFLPAVRILKPRRIIALGKKVSSWPARLGLGDIELHVIRRTIGDSYFHEDAARALEILRQSTQEARK